MRNYSVIISLLLLLFSCASKKELEGYTLTGNTQGTTYNIIIAENSIAFTQMEVDRILANFDTVLSTYIPESHISKINLSQTEYSFNDKYGYFEKCYDLSQDIYKESNGLFDPSMYPLLKSWGFLKTVDDLPTQEEIDSIKQFVGFEAGKYHKATTTGTYFNLTKLDSRFQLDFNAIAQGYSVDVVADFIESRGHKNYYVEIGGEIRVAGLNRSGKKWQIGIDVPQEENTVNMRETITSIKVTDCGIATSGNYRNFIEKDGKRFGHILNPVSGKPGETDILSITMIAPNAALADGYATALVIMGLEKAKDFLKKHSSLQAIIIYTDEKGNFKLYDSRMITNK